ncbi:MAG: hypothetical protein B7Y89_05425 [Novosphingobium sp. 32-60-15]|nr:MAG: hypothetical protein B7Y89_05425 [Novosphingobium sp. 32-60-15]
MDTILTVLQWYGAGAGVIAAAMVSMDLGRRLTGMAFVIFVTSSVALIAWGFLNDEATGIGVQNIILLLINCLGVYRYLVREAPAT